MNSKPRQTTYKTLLHYQSAHHLHSCTKKLQFISIAYAYSYHFQTVRYVCITDLRGKHEESKGFLLKFSLIFVILQSIFILHMHRKPIVNVNILETPYSGIIKTIERLVSILLTHSYELVVHVNEDASNAILTITSLTNNTGES